MKFLQTLGLAKAEDIDEDGVQILSLEAEKFLRSGGSLSLDDWKDFTEPEKKAFNYAGDRLKARDMYLMIRAMSDPEEAARIYAAVDGGRAYLERLVDRVKNGGR